MIVSPHNEARLQYQHEATISVQQEIGFTFGGKKAKQTLKTLTVSFALGLNRVIECQEPPHISQSTVHPKRNQLGPSYRTA